MTLVLERREALDLEGYLRVAWQGEPMALSPAALHTIEEARRGFLRMIETEPDVVVYGTTTRAGDGARLRLDRDAMDAQGRTPPNPGPNWGPPLPERVVRGIVLARVAGWLGGHGGVRASLAQAVAAMLGGAALPPVPAEGNGGAGEILALGHLFHDFAVTNGTELKEPMALVNGSPCATALVADAALSGRARLALAYQVLALSAEAIRAPLESYAPAFETLWADPHEARAVRRLRELLTGGAAQRRPYQAPVSWRIEPKVLGRASRAVETAAGTAERALRSVTDNPVYLPPWESPPNGRALSNGGYHNANAYAAIDGLTAAWADLVQLLERQCEHLIFPPGAAPVGDGFRMFMMVQSAWAEEARAAAQTTLIGLGAQGQNDTPTPTFLAFRRLERVSWCLDAALAVVAALSSVALGRAGGPVPPALSVLVEEVRSRFPVADEGSRRSRQVQRVQEYFSALAQVAVAKEEAEGLPAGLPGRAATAPPDPGLDVPGGLPGALRVDQNGCA